MTEKTEDHPVVTRAQLALRNGQDKPQIWVAYKGLVYDVSASRLWHRGTHYTHWAGQDLTAELADAPHTDQVFLKFKVVAKLAN
jgi:predicted heme/steroid binding protein